MIGDRLKELRHDHNDTQEDLAEKLNISKFTVQSWEQGKSEPNHDMLVTICRLYHVSSDFLLGLSDDDPVFYQTREMRLSQESRTLLKEFSDFLFRKERKKSARH